MRQFFLLALVVGAVMFVIAAVVFRSRRALNAARFLRNVAWVYIAVIVALALWRWWQMG